MGGSLQTLIKATNGKNGRVIDLSRFAISAFSADVFPEPTKTMAAMSQAAQLLNPTVLWIDLLHLAELSIGQPKLDVVGLPALRSFLEDEASVNKISRNLISVRSAIPKTVPIILDLGSPAEWMRFYGEEPEEEIDDLDAEDILIFLVNALQRVDIDRVAGLSFDSTSAIAGDLSTVCESVANFCDHQQLVFFIGEPAEPDNPYPVAQLYQLHPNLDDGTANIFAWRVTANTPPDQALKFFKTTSNPQEN